MKGKRKGKKVFVGWNLMILNVPLNPNHSMTSKIVQGPLGSTKMNSCFTLVLIRKRRGRMSVLNGRLGLGSHDGSV